AFFPAHASALGFDYWDEADSPDVIKNSFLVALHGSTNKAIGHGYRIVIMRKGEPLEDLVNGFLQRSTVLGRPCDILKIDASSFLFTDDHSGIIYLVRKKGTTTHLSELGSPTETDAPAAANNEPTPSPSKGCLSVVLVFAATLVRSIL